MNRDWIRSILTVGMNDYERRLQARWLDRWQSEFEQTPGARSSGLTAESEVREAVVFYLKGRLQKDALEIAGLRRSHAEFVKRVSRAPNVHARERAILEFAQVLGSTPRDLRRDRRAFRRWFDEECVSERSERQIHELESGLTRGLERLGAVAADWIGRVDSRSRRRVVWQRVGLNDLLKPLFTYEGDVRVTRAAVGALAAMLSVWPGIAEASFDQGMLQYVCQSALHSKQDVWVQCLSLEMLPILAPESVAEIFERRLTRSGDDGDLFVRRRLVEILVRQVPEDAELEPLLDTAVEDPSPYVRQGLANALAHAPTHWISPWLERLILDDGVAQVRAAGILALGSIVGRRDLEEYALGLLGRAADRESDRFTQRVCIHVCAEVAQLLARRAARPDVSARLHDTVDRLRHRAVDVQVRRWAAAAMERIWCASDPDASSLREALHDPLSKLRSGHSIVLPGDWQRRFGEEMIGRVLAVESQKDFGFDVQFGRRAMKVRRGHLFGFRWWRFLHELRNSAPDKRQAFHHNVGRFFHGDLHVPSGILAELTETRVPGEPLYMESEGGWRPYLPLADEFLSSVANPLTSRPFKVYTSEGVTEVSPAPSVLGRVRAAAAMTWRMTRYTQLRNFHENSQEDPGEYIRAQRRLGFEVRFRPHGERVGAADPTVARFFSGVGLLPIFDNEYFYDLQEYFLSLYENSLFDLLAFSGGALTLFLGHHWRANRALRIARDKLPLVIGGWGTRGKSGSERLKAALFNALGYGVVSKTTGCEAMFLYCHPFGKTHEMFLFRPYDKATIWEQAHLVRLAADLKADVFLWECMGLNPQYVDILQRQWMQDDLATLTNAYPDHEDVQGPAGFNIPEAMTKFIPEQSTLVTSEELMLPILADDARDKMTRMRAVDWIQQGLLTDDVLKRFPYEEHPSNIALILALADELGIDRDFTLKEIADHVVPDLGVLKTYPTAIVDSRRLEFTNGNSANDRHGAVGNYRRLGFDKQDCYRQPDVWKTTVVNNRADRIPRSRVFARILVEDITADRHYLIGNNLNGLVGYIREAWDAHTEDLSLWPKVGDGSAEAILEREARKRRVPLSQDDLVARAQAMLGEGNWDDELAEFLGAAQPDLDRVRAWLRDSGEEVYCDEISRHLEAGLTALDEYRDLRMRVQAATPNQREELDGQFRDLLWLWFERSLVVVEDYGISGNGLVRLISDDTPPRFRNRILGLQNIKGTVLDFVYAWQGWEACHRACSRLLDRSVREARQGLRQLAGIQDYGLLAEEHMKMVLEEIAESRNAQTEEFQAELSLIRTNFEAALRAVRADTADGPQAGVRWSWLLDTLENFLDPGDSVKRRKTADRIYRDLVHARISSERAVRELKFLIQRQKGGWLAGTFAALRKRWTVRATDDPAALATETREIALTR